MPNALYYGDNLEISARKHIQDESIDLVLDNYATHKYSPKPKVGDSQ